MRGSSNSNTSNNIVFTFSLPIKQTKENIKFCTFSIISIENRRLETKCSKSKYSNGSLATKAIPHSIKNDNLISLSSLLLLFSLPHSDLMKKKTFRVRSN